MIQLFPSLNLYQKGLEGIRLRSEVIADNVANIETPGYKAKELRFEEVFAEHIRRRNNQSGPPAFIMGSRFLLRESKDFSVQSNGNNVSMEKEMIESAKNNMMYDVVTKALNTRISLLKSAIHEGKR